MAPRPSAILLLTFTLALGGCLALPLPLPEDKVLTGTPVTPEQLSFLAVGRTTADEVTATLGQPNVIWEDVRVFIYIWDMRQGVLFWAVGGMAGGTTTGQAGMTDIPKHYLLLIQFDEKGRVLRHERTARPLTRSLSDFLVDWLANPGNPSGAAR